MMEVSYGTWKLTAPVALILAFLGLLTGAVEFFVAAMIPALLVLMSAVSRTPDTGSLVIERSIADRAPSPGEEVEVRLTVRNEGRSTFTDLRVIDSVPADLRVSQGSPRASVAVAPGSERTISYSVIARRGSHVFDTARLEARGGGRTGLRGEIEVQGDDRIACTTELEEVLLRDETRSQVGDIVTSSGGSGIEFHSLREYKASDPPSRVEWKHLAKTGELATKNFREERAGNVVLVIDARAVSDRKAAMGHPTGTDLDVYAAERVYSHLLKSRHSAGIAVLGVRPEDIDVTMDSAMMPYIAPGRSREKRRKVEQILKEVQQAEKIDEDGILERLYGMLPPDAQVVFFTPLLEDGLADTLKALDRHGYPSTVVSPDVTYGDGPASRLARVQRELRMKEVRKAAPVIDWDIDRPMSIQVSNALRRIYARDI